MAHSDNNIQNPLISLNAAVVQIVYIDIRAKRICNKKE